MDAPAAEALRDLAEEAGPGLAGLDRRALLEELEARHDELLTAMDWFLEHRRADDATRIATSLVPFWMATRRLDEGSEWFERILGRSGDDPAIRGRGLFDAGLLAFWRGADDQAAALHREALEVGRRAEDPTVTALALTGLARIALRSDIAEARSLCRDALAATEGTRDRLGRSNAVHVLGVAAQMAGDLVEARELMTERMALARELGSDSGVASEAGNLSVVERQLGDLERAESLALEALDIARRREDEWMIPYLLNSLAAVVVARAEFERGASLIGVAESMVDAQGADWPPDERVHYDQTVMKLTEALGEAELERLRRESHLLTTTEALARALRAGS